MGILNLIQREKDKFRVKGREYSKEEITQAQKRLVQGDIEVYDNKKKSVREMISSAKTKFRQTQTRMEMMKEKHIEKQNKKLKSDLENLRLKNKVATQKEQLGKGLRAILGGINVPTVQKREYGGNPFPVSTAQTEKPKKPRNELGGTEPFG